MIRGTREPAQATPTTLTLADLADLAATQGATASAADAPTAPTVHAPPSTRQRVLAAPSLPGGGREVLGESHPDAGHARLERAAKPFGRTGERIRRGRSDVLTAAEVDRVSGCLTTLSPRSNLATYAALARPRRFAMGFTLFHDEDSLRMKAKAVRRIRPAVSSVSFP
jgi:hypothetical protein